MRSLFLLSLGLLSLLLTSCVGAEWVEQVAPQYLRRNLALKTIPLDFVLKLAVSAGSDKRPTSNDYTKVASAVKSWFDTNSKRYYANATTYRYSSTSCTYRTSGSTWISNAADGYPHTVSLDCSSTFDAANTNLVPSNAQVMRNANAFSFKNFTKTYLVPAVASDSVFKSTVKVSYTMNVITPSRPSAPASAPTMRAPTSAPVRTASSTQTGSVTATATAGSARTASTSSTPLATTTRNATIDLVLEWTLGTSTVARGSGPTDAQYAVFLTKTNEWLNNVLRGYYTGSSKPQIIAVSSTYRSKSYAASSAMPLKMVVASKFTFRLKPGQSLPPKWELVSFLRGIGMTNFQNGYQSIMPDIFKNAKPVQWKALL